MLNAAINEATGLRDRADVQWVIKIGTVKLYLPYKVFSKGFKNAAYSYHATPSGSSLEQKKHNSKFYSCDTQESIDLCKHEGILIRIISFIMFFEASSWFSNIGVSTPLIKKSVLLQMKNKWDTTTKMVRQS